MGCGASQDLSATFSEEDGVHDTAKYGNGHGLGQPQQSVQINELCDEAPKTGEEGTFVLPEGEFVDGQLGITEEDNFESMRNELLVDGKFEDEDFPASIESIFFSERASDDAGIEWMRPNELVDEPKVFVDGVSRRDVIQGALGDCWFLSSCAAVARKSKLIQRIPDSHDVDGQLNPGLIRCKITVRQCGPVCCGDRWQAQQRQWLATAAAAAADAIVLRMLLCQAYDGGCRLHGSYEALEGGQSMDAMVDLTGGLAERYDMEDTPDKKRLYKLLLKASKNGAFITASRKGDWRMAYKTDENGLVEGHAYTVSGVARVRHDDLGLVNLIRVRNPWANSAEWSGQWADDAICSGISNKVSESNNLDPLTHTILIAFNNFYMILRSLDPLKKGRYEPYDPIGWNMDLLTFKGALDTRTPLTGSTRNQYEKSCASSKDLLFQHQQDDNNLLGFVVVLQHSDEKDLLFQHQGAALLMRDLLI
ncbi:unnamed protein product, partial [Meganyctiphanes norvegica]